MDRVSKQEQKSLKNGIRKNISNQNPEERAAILWIHNVEEGHGKINTHGEGAHSG